MTTARQRWAGAAVIVIIALATLGVAVFQPLGGDDVYVLENLSSGRWAARLFAFDVDTPSAGYGPWWSGFAFQRRFLRIPSSGLLWIQWELFGRSAVPYHLITLALVIAGCLLLYRLALRHVSAPQAVLIAAVPAVHPSSAEVVGTLNCQPLAVAGLFCVATVVAWDRMRRTGSRPAFAAALAFCALAITSYEAAAVLPFALLLADAVLWNDHASSPRSWVRRLGLFAVFVAYVPGAVAIRRGLTAPDTGPLRPLSEVWRSARLDAAAYGLKTFGLFDPRAPAAYWLHRIAGEPLAIAVAIGLLAAVIILVRRQRLGWLGLVVFASFLMLPWITRATVAQMNLPTLRQLHLPVLLGGPLVVAGLLAGVRSRAMAAVGCAWLVGLSVETIVVGCRSAPIPARRAMSSSLRAVLADVPAERTIVSVGDDLCGTSPSLLRPGGVLLAIPDADEDEAAPALTVIDAHTLIARVPGAFDVPEREEQPAREHATDRGPAWLVRRPPPIVLNGWQQIPGARVSAVARGPRGIQALRYRFDEPLSQLVFLRFRGCSAPERVTLPSIPAEG